MFACQNTNFFVYLRRDQRKSPEISFFPRTGIDCGNQKPSNKPHIKELDKWSLVQFKIFFLKLFIVIIRILFAAGDGVTAAINAEFEGDLTCGRAISERWKVAKFLLWLKVNSLKIQTNDRILVQPHYYQTQYRSRITKSKWRWGWILRYYFKNTYSTS